MTRAKIHEKFKAWLRYCLCMIVLLLGPIQQQAFAIESVENYNRFSLPTDSYTGNCNGSSANNPNQVNIYTTAKNKGWVYAGFLYAAFLSTLNQYQAMHGNSSVYDGSEEIGTSGLFTLAACDMSYCMLERIFGFMPGIFLAEGSPHCGEINQVGPQTFNNLMRLLNMGIFVVVCVVIGYGLIGKGILMGGFEGDILQKNLTMMTFTRMGVSIFSIIPIPGVGYSALQVFIMYIVLLGVGFADSTFRVALNAFVTYGTIFSFAGIDSSSDGDDSGSNGSIDFTTINAQSLFNINTQPTSNKYADIMQRFACATYVSVKNDLENMDDPSLNSVYNSANAISFNRITKMTVNDLGLISIQFDDYGGDYGNDGSGSTNPACGEITWNPNPNSDGTTMTVSEFQSQPAYMMLQQLYNSAAEAMYQAKVFWSTGTQTQTQKNYLTCLSGTNIGESDLMLQLTDATGQHLCRTNYTLCKYDTSTTNRQTALANYVNLTSPYASANQIYWQSGCSGNCVEQLSRTLIDNIATVIDTTEGVDATQQLSTQQLAVYSFQQAIASSDPTTWVINTDVTPPFSQPYTEDLLIMTQTYNIMTWLTSTTRGTDNLYNTILGLSSPDNSTTNQAPALSSSMDMTSMNVMVQSMLAPFFGSNPVKFIDSKGKILTWKNIAVSSNYFITSLMMILQRMIGFHYYDPSQPMTSDWYTGEGGGDNPSVYGKCQSTYSSHCMGSNIDNCFSEMNSAGCFMNQDNVGRGLIGTLGLMYSVGEAQFGTVITYNPIADYIEIGYTIMTSATYYLFLNSYAIMAMYAELAGVTMGANAVTTLGLAGIITLSNYASVPWCNRQCKYLLMEMTSVIKLSVNIFSQIDSDRIDFYSTIGTTLITLLVPFGAMLTILLPLYPTIIFIVGIFGWLASVVEALIAGPIVAVGLAHPEGNDFLGKSEMGIGILFQTFLRPVLIVIGVVMSVCVINISFYAFSIAFSTTYASLAGTTSIMTTGAIKNSLGAVGTALATYDSWEVILAITIALIMVYAYTSWEIISFCCVSMISFSNQVLAWVSSGSDSRFTSTVDILAATKGQVQSDAGAVAKSLKTDDKVAGLGRQISQISQSTLQDLSQGLRKVNRKNAENIWSTLSKDYKGVKYAMGYGNEKVKMIKDMNLLMRDQGKNDDNGESRAKADERRAKMADIHKRSIDRLVQNYNNGDPEAKKELMNRVDTKTAMQMRLGLKPAIDPESLKRDAGALGGMYNRFAKWAVHKKWGVDPFKDLNAAELYQSGYHDEQYQQEMRDLIYKRGEEGSSNNRGNPPPIPNSITGQENPSGEN
jgi:hypothetical protein